MNKQIGRHKFCTGKRKDVLPFNSCHVETVCLLINQNAQAKHHVNVGIDAEDYYKIKEGK